MKRILSPFAALMTITLSAVLCCCLHGCSPIRDYKTTCQGVLYSDSTKTMPLAHDTLIVREDGVIAIMETDEYGRFGFSWWNNGVDQTSSSDAKSNYLVYFICLDGDTLWAGSTSSEHKEIVIYPGINWRKNYGYAE